MTRLPKTLLSRRMFLASAAAVVAAACSDQIIVAIDLPSNPFTLGVASGDPDTESVVLWTRLAPLPLEGGGMPAHDVPVLWETSATADFATIDSSGQEIATADSGHSVHAIVTLSPGVWYYRFRCGQYVSSVGITRPAPNGSLSEVNFAAASCQRYSDGYYAAHRDIAERAPDFLLWLGDYIYEGAGGEGGDPAERIHLGPEPTTLEEYRNRYARYKTDVNLQAAHAVCPWFVIWDDHEVDNNYAGLIPQAIEEASTFAARRFAAYRAWWEHLPVRLQQPTAQDAEYRVYRDARWGDLLTLALLDGRQYRSDQACGDAASLEQPCAEAADPNRTMLGDEQESWLIETLTASTSQWNVLGNQCILTNATLNGAVLNFDQWDGYPVARERLLASMHSASVQNLVVITGDIHMAAVGQLHSDGTNIGVEFVTTSISSAGNFGPEFAEVIKSFPDLIDAELAHRGYSFHTVTPERWTANYRIVADVSSPNSIVLTYANYVVEAGSNTVAIAP